MADEQKKEHHHHKWTDKFMHHDPGYTRQQVAQDAAKNKTSASAMKTEDAGTGDELVQQKSPGLWQKFERRVAKENARNETDDIWGHYKGPGH